MPCVYLVLLVGGWGGFVLREIWRGDWGGGGGGLYLGKSGEAVSKGR